MKGSYHLHQQLLRSIQIEVQKIYKDAIFFPLFSGLVQRQGDWIRIGIDGWPDLIVCIPIGKVLSVVAIEVKSGEGKLRKEQISFKKMWESRGGLHIVGRSVDQVLTEIEGWVQTCSN